MLWELMQNPYQFVSIWNRLVNMLTVQCINILLILWENRQS